MTAGFRGCEPRGHPFSPSPWSRNPASSGDAAVSWGQSWWAEQGGTQTTPLHPKTPRERDRDPLGRAQPSSQVQVLFSETAELLMGMRKQRQSSARAGRWGRRAKKNHPTQGPGFCWRGGKAGEGASIPMSVPVSVPMSLRAWRLQEMVRGLRGGRCWGMGRPRSLSCPQGWGKPGALQAPGGGQEGLGFLRLPFPSPLDILWVPLARPQPQQGHPKQGAQPHGQALSLAGTKIKGIWAHGGTQTPAPVPVVGFLC